MKEMEIILKPKQELIERAEELDFHKMDKTPCYMGMSSTVALLTGKMFDEPHYLGTATILKYRLRDGTKYAITNRGPIYAGDLLRIAIKILGEKRVHFFLNYKGNDKSFAVLLLGTKNGTVAIAPSVPNDNEPKLIEEFNEDMQLLTDYLRGTTPKFKRGVIFESI